MLFVVTAEKEERWWVGCQFPQNIDPKSVIEIQADGDERVHIESAVRGIRSHIGLICNWYGEDAVFIASYLKSKYRKEGK